ncbi:MAG TPA: O-antigen ligase family protein [Vicinamibacterales bacterium]|nr:O-antigen ligase family protein [Vicinamibacterales bacterium]
MVPTPLAVESARSSDRTETGWDPLLVCVAGYMLMSVGRVHQLFGLEALRPAILTGGLAILLYLVDDHEQRRILRVWMPTTKYLLALFGWMLLSVPGSLSEGTSFTLVFGNFAKTMLMFIVVTAAVRDVRDVERLAFAYFGAAAMYASVVVSRFDVGAGADWRLGHLYYYDANDFATFAVTALPFGIYFLQASERALVRLFSAAALAVLTLGFVYSGSRGGFLALLAVAVFVVARYTVIPLRWRVSATMLVAVVLLAAASDQYWRQMGTIFSDADYNRTGETGRLQIWERGLGYMMAHPVLGVGPDNFPVAEGTLSPFASRQQYGIGVRWSAAHNSFIQVGAELGFPGLLLFVALLASAFAALRRTRRRQLSRADGERDAHDLTQAVTASLIGFVVGAFFLSLAYSEMLYTLLALVAGLHKLTPRHPEC